VSKVDYEGVMKKRGRCLYQVYIINKNLHVTAGFYFLKNIDGMGCGSMNGDGDRNREEEERRKKIWIS